MTDLSPLHAARLHEKISVPNTLKNLKGVAVEKGEATSAIADAEKLQELFPHLFGQPQVRLVPGEGRSGPLKVGVVLSGGQAPGGHNVIAGLFDATTELIGFVGGPSGIVDNKTVRITKELIDSYRNLGGFDIIGSGRTKIETEEQLAGSLKTAQDLALDGLVVIGGDDSNTNAAVLAEYFLANGCTTKVIGVPKTIDGDLKNDQIEISFGHDTACRVYSELIGNLMRDALSARKYYHFVRLMGRSASHITLECALQTQPNVTLISEEGKSLSEIVTHIVDVVEKRAAKGKHFGVILIPEGLIEFIPEIGKLISELNALLAEHKAIDTMAKTEEKVAYLVKMLSHESAKTLQQLPESIQSQLLLDRDPHGNVQVSRIETEKLLIEMVKERCKLNAIHHFFGYEGRSALPTHFDCRYCYALGLVAATLIQNGLTGYMSCVRNLAHPVADWAAGGVPLTMMMNMEERHGRPKPVIQKALVDLKGAPMAKLNRHRMEWAQEEAYRYPGPIQFAGDPSITDQLPITLGLESR